MFAVVGVELRMTTMQGVFGLLFPISWNRSKRRRWSNRMKMRRRGDGESSLVDHGPLSL